ncbi:MAG: sigma 54-dependent Fis family transcriptional regulator, partial [Myxococcales bacterium]|nr:sigma 54-dependent Fis family transcriptional regulator [Myxococcales bacterium]
MASVPSVITTAIRPTEIAFERFALRVLSGADEGKEVISAGEETTVGTDPGNDLILSDRAVSRHHVSIRASARGLELRDLGSTNGTVLGGHRVLHALLEPGALIGCGRTVLRLDLVGGEVRETLSERERFGRALGASPAMRRVFALMDRFAPSEGTVLIEGETGTGKELIAEAIHDASPRAAGPFVVVDCGAIPITLIEAELFGHVRGAFTGATENRRGAFESARGGTVFLDEIGELPPAVQPVLLRVLEDRTVKRVGDDRRIPIHVRVVAATHRDLREEVNRSRFRADLYYRLAVLRLRVPALRERREDIPLLIRHFCATFRADDEDAAEAGDPADPTSLSDELVTALAAQSWPGNVRELRSAVQRALLL